MKYKQRKSESNIPQKIVEYLQAGILIRFNEEKFEVTEFEGSDKNKIFRCDEFWFSLDSTIEEIKIILKNEGFELTEEHKKLIK